MAVLTATAFYSKWNARFADNTSRDIVEGDFREFSEDIKDSMFFTAGTLPTLTASATITQSAMNAANSVPVEIIPAQGSGIIIVPIMFMVYIQYGSAPFATNITFRFEINGEAVSLSDSVILPSVSNRTSIIAVNTSDFLTDLSNQPCVLQVQTGDPTGGTGSIVFVSAVYSTLNVN